MRTNQFYALRVVLLITLMVSLTVLSTRLQADTSTCGGATTTLPFTDVMASPFFCQIASAYFSGLTSGTTATTYSPGANVTREQMAAFVTRTMDQSLKRGSKRAVAKKWFTPQTANSLGLTTVGNNALTVKSDGTDLWVANFGSGTVSRVRASDGRLLETWTGATGARAVLAADGKVYVTGLSTPGKLYQIDPTQTPGAVTTLTSSLGSNPTGIAYDGERIWIANQSVEIVSLNPISVTTVTAGLFNVAGILFDGANIWVADGGDNTLKKLNANGSVLLSVALGSNAGPVQPTFDGTNIWVPNNSNSTVTVVRATGSLAGSVIATLTENGLSGPLQAAFDGERILVTNFDSVSLWRASDLSPLGTFFNGERIFPFGVCSNGLNFWFPVSRGSGRNYLARF